MARKEKKDFDLARHLSVDHKVVLKGFEKVRELFRQFSTRQRAAEIQGIAEHYQNRNERTLSQRRKNPVSSFEPLF